MGNVWRPNTIKHCLVTKHVYVEPIESAQTVSNTFDQTAIESQKQAVSMDTSQRAITSDKRCPKDQNTRTKKDFKECLTACQLY